MGFLCTERQQQSTFLVSQPSQFIILMYLSNINKTHCFNAATVFPVTNNAAFVACWAASKYECVQQCEF